MSDTINVYVVHDLKHLFEVVTWNFLRESFNCNEIKELSTTDKFKSHVGNRYLCTITSNFNCVFFKRN